MLLWVYEHKYIFLILLWKAYKKNNDKCDSAWFWSERRGWMKTQHFINEQKTKFCFPLQPKGYSSIYTSLSVYTTYMDGKYASEVEWWFDETV